MRRLAYDSLWTWDHLFPIIGDPTGPFLEAYTILGAWSQLTSKLTLGLMVGANTFRNPAIVAKAEALRVIATFKERNPDDAETLGRFATEVRPAVG